jgi:hypothetical protein
MGWILWENPSGMKQPRKLNRSVLADCRKRSQAVLNCLVLLQGLPRLIVAQVFLRCTGLYLCRASYFPTKQASSSPS